MDERADVAATRNAELRAKTGELFAWAEELIENAGREELAVALETVVFLCSAFVDVLAGLNADLNAPAPADLDAELARLG